MKYNAENFSLYIGGFIMKRLFAVLTLIFLLASPAFALSDSEYLKMKRNYPKFARADRNLTRVWNELKKELSTKDFKELQKNQREWIAKGRDDAANEYINEGYSRVEAYTRATNDRANALPQIAADIEQGIISSKKPASTQQPARPQRKKAPAPKPEPEPEPEYDEDDNDYDDDDDNRGEIEEERFDGETFAGNYTRRDKNAFMTVIITDDDTMEAEAVISTQNPETTWKARGWIEENVLELSDENYSRCQLTLTFANNSVKVEATKSEDWQEVFGEDIDLSGTYTRSK